MCREGKADMALDLYTTARAEGIKPNLVICDSIIGTCHELEFLFNLITGFLTFNICLEKGMHSQLGL